MPDAPTRQQKITLGEMRSSGVRGLLVYCADYKCSHLAKISGDRWPDSLILNLDSFAKRAEKEAPSFGEMMTLGKRSHDLLSGADDVRPHRRHAGVEPSRRTRAFDPSRKDKHTGDGES